MEGGGAKSLFQIFARRDFSFFPIEFPILVDQEISVVSKKWKEERERKKKRISPSLFHRFSHYPLFPLPPFFCIFHLFSYFFLAYFSRLVSKDFPLTSLGGHCPGGTAMCPACYANWLAVDIWLSAGQLDHLFVVRSNGQQNLNTVVGLNIDRATSLGLSLYINDQVQWPL